MNIQTHDAICLLRGFSITETTAGLKEAAQSLEQATHSNITLQYRYIGDSDLNRIVGELIEEVIDSDKTPGSFPVPPGGEQPAGGIYQVAIVYALDKQTVFTLMKCMKQVVADTSKVIFAMVTEKAAGWTCSYYLQHLGKEHEYMKTHSPADDPDMKPV